MHCFVKSLIVLIIVRILTFSIRKLSLHLKHLALSVYQCIMLIRIQFFRPVAGWNEYVKEHYTSRIAEDALWWWKYHNKPKNGAIYYNMRSSKSRFKYALRSVRSSE